MAGWVSQQFERLPLFFRKAFWSFLMRFGGLFLQLLGSILIARLLGVEQFGAFTFAATWAVFIGLLLPMGMGDLSIRELPRYLTKKQLGPLSGFLISTILTVLIFGSFSAIALAVLEHYKILELAPGWKLVAIYTVIHGLILSVSNALNGFRRILTSQFLETILRQVIYLALIGAALWASLDLTADRVFSILLVAAIPILLIMIFVLIRIHEQTGARQVKPEYLPRIWMIGALPLLMNALANRLQLQLGVLMVGSILGDIETGVFRVAARGAMLVSIANMIAIQLVGPLLSKALAEEDREKAQKLLSQAAMVSFLAGIPICLVLGFGAYLYLGLFGPGFQMGGIALQLLLVGQATIILAGADSILLVMLGKERLVFLMTSAGVALNFVLNFLLIGPYGIQGAAFASLVSIALVRGAMVTYVIRTTGYDTTIFRPLRRYLSGRK